MLGLYFWSRSRSNNYWSCFFLLAETVRNTNAQQAVIRTTTNGVRVTDVVGPLVFQTGSDFRSNCILYATSEYWGYTSVVVFEAFVVFSVCTPNHTTQTETIVAY